jgi:hypothetical protein
MHRKSSLNCLWTEHDYYTQSVRSVRRTVPSCNFTFICCRRSHSSIVSLNSPNMIQGLLVYACSITVGHINLDDSHKRICGSHNSPPDAVLILTRLALPTPSFEISSPSLISPGSNRSPEPLWDLSSWRICSRSFLVRAYDRTYHFSA